MTNSKKPTSKKTSSKPTTEDLKNKLARAMADYANLEKRFKWLAKEPRLGKHRTDIAEGYYSFPEGQHIVFYIINHERIEIIGIPHKDMDIISYFQTH